MWLLIIVVLGFALVFGGTGWGARYGAMRWSPAAIILAVAGVLYLTGHLHLDMH